jgi:hypothetical protein
VLEDLLEEVDGCVEVTMRRWNKFWREYIGNIVAVETFTT